MAAEEEDKEPEWDDTDFLEEELEWEAAFMRRYPGVL